MDDKNKNAIEVYDLIAEDYAKKFDSIESGEDLRFPNLFLSHLKPESSILDLGCGTGSSAGYFTQKGMVVEGIDLSRSMISIAKRNYPNIKFTVGDMREFSPEEPVSAVWAGYSLFHFEQEFLKKTIDKIKTYLSPGGTLGLVMQKGTGEIESNEPLLPEKKIYIHLYTEAELTTILEHHGFEVVGRDIKKAKKFEFPHDKILLVAKLK